MHGAEVDVIEEVARHYGYGAIARTERRSPKVGQASPRPVSAIAGSSDAQVAGDRGLRSLDRASLVDPAILGHLGSAVTPLRVLNPVVSGEDTLRTHLVAGLLAALERNVARRSTSVKLFELGKVFSRL